MHILTYIIVVYRNDPIILDKLVGQTVYTQIRLLLKELSNQGLHCSLVHMHHLEGLHHGRTSLGVYCKATCLVGVKIF